MKKLLICGLLLFAVCSCNETLTDVPDSPPMTRAISETVFSYDSITKPEVWSTFQSLEEMQAACQIPDSLLSIMTTDELAKACVDYPLYGIYSAYNNEEDGVKVIMNGFNGFKELLSREDGAAALVECYEAFDADKLASAMAEDADYHSDYNPLKLGYLELLLGSDEVTSKLSTSESEELEQLQMAQLRKKESLPKYFGRKSLERTSNKLLATTGMVKVKTKCGKDVLGFLREEMSEYDIGYNDGYYDATFPNAERIGSSSTTYNCHSYAWCMSDGGTTCWINANTKGQNISKYWTRDYYTSCTAENAVKIFYPNSDHSAIKYGTSGLYVSKWGSAPLMAHAPGYGPYSDMDTRNYYCHTNIYSALACSEGTDEIEVGTEATYSVNFDSTLIPNGSNVETEWVVENAKGEDAIGNQAELTEVSTGSASITFNHSGVYEISFVVRLKDCGYEMIRCSYEALVIN